MKRFVVYYEDPLGLHRKTKSFDMYKQAKELHDELKRSEKYSYIEIIDQDELIRS